MTQRYEHCGAITEFGDRFDHIALQELKGWELAGSHLVPHAEVLRTDPGMAPHFCHDTVWVQLYFKRPVERLLLAEHRQ